VLIRKNRHNFGLWIYVSEAVLCSQGTATGRLQLLPTESSTFWINPEEDLKPLKDLVLCQHRFLTAYC
jgi:hypothetical protein